MLSLSRFEQDNNSIRFSIPVFIVDTTIFVRHDQVKCHDRKPTPHCHTDGRLTNSDWFANSYTMVLHEHFLFKFSQNFLSKGRLKMLSCTTIIKLFTNIQNWLIFRQCDYD